ncbi:hypothetical protein VNI00_003063 [Paramarasmius palmivorus]|uniref:AAA+ ATPase domain-containing protein n=1 Tax=Paramarasmius palmivorus TaxID=297713 RepID=A0AAW0DYG3_9AGAR
MINLSYLVFTGRPTKENISSINIHSDIIQVEPTDRLFTLADTILAQYPQFRDLGLSVSVYSPNVPTRLNPDAARQLLQNQALNEFAKQLSQDVTVHQALPGDLIVCLEAPLVSHASTDNNLLHNPLRLNHVYIRPDTVEAMAKHILRHKFLLVRGTPGTGKTTLLRLLKRYIETHVDGARTEIFESWSLGPGESTRLCLRDSRIRGTSGMSLRDIQHLREREQKKLFIFIDEAQGIYWDTDFWSGFVKDILDDRRRVNLVLFATYGPPDFNRSYQSGVPPHICPTDMMGLFSTEHVDLQLLFGYEEYQCLIKHLEVKQDWMVIIDQDLKDYIYGITNGHVGAVTTLFTMAGVAKVKDRRDDTVSLNDFLNYWNTPQAFYDGLMATKSSFSQGLPNIKELREHSEAEYNLLREVVNNECQGMFNPGYDVDSKDAFTALKEAGCLYHHEVSRWHWKTSALATPSPLHRAWFSYELRNPTFSGRMSLDDTWKEVLARFSKSALRRDEKIDLGERCANEFYRCLYELTAGACFISPEFAQKQMKLPCGGVDFLVGDWGIELLRDEDRLQVESHPWIRTQSDHVILDFRKKADELGAPRTDCPRLFRVVFEDDYSGFEVFDHMGERVGATVSLKP